MQGENLLKKLNLMCVISYIFRCIRRREGAQENKSPCELDHDINPLHQRSRTTIKVKSRRGIFKLKKGSLPIDVFDLQSESVCSVRLSQHQGFGCSPPVQEVSGNHMLSV